MSRTSRSVPTLALAALLAGFALTGCADSKSGAAAVVDGDRIDISTLNSHVRQAADARESVGAQPVSGIEASQEQLTTLVTDKILDEAARRAGVVVTGTEIAGQKRAWAALNPGVALEAILARDGVPAEAIDHFARRTVLVDKLIVAHGGNPETQAGQALAVRVFTDTAESMKITVNPRYGTWDNAGGLVPTTYGWLTPDQIV